MLIGWDVRVGAVMGYVATVDYVGMSYPMAVASLLTLVQLLSFRIDIVGPI